MDDVYRALGSSTAVSSHGGQQTAGEQLPPHFARQKKQILQLIVSLASFTFVAVGCGRGRLADDAKRGIRLVLRVDRGVSAVVAVRGRHHVVAVDART